MKLKYPITVYTLYKYDVWIDPNSYEQKTYDYKYLPYLQSKTCIRSNRFNRA